MKKSPVLTFLALCITQSSLAGTFIDNNGNATLTREQMQTRHAVLNDRHSRADKLRDHHGIFRMVRQQYFFGNNGVILRSDAWFDSAELWIADIRVLVEKLNQDYIEQVANKRHDFDDLKMQLNNLSIQLTMLMQESASIQGRIARGKTLLESVPELPINYIPGSENTIIQFNDSVKDLNNKFDAIQVKLNGQLSTVMMDLLDNVRTTVVVMSKRLQLHFPQLEQLLQKVQDMIRATEFITPLVQNIKDRVAEIDATSDTNRPQPFKALRLYEELLEAVEDAKSYINHYVTNPSDQQFGLNQLDFQVGRATDAKDYVYSRRKRLLMNSYISTLRRMKVYCSDKYRDNTTYNCALWQNISGLNRKIFNKLDDKKLSYLEETIEKIYNNEVY